METHLKQTSLGYGLAVLCCILWVSSGAAVQALGRKVPDFQLGVLRYIGTMFIAALLMSVNKVKLTLQRESYVHVLLMGISSVGYNCLFFLAASLVPLSHLSIELVCVMISITVISRIFFDKSNNIIISTCIFGCILGMICLIQPWMNFTYGFTPEFIASANNQDILMDVDSADKYSTSKQSADNSTLYHTAAISSTSWLVFGYLALVAAAVFESFYILLAGFYLNKVQPGLLVFVVSGVALVMCFICSLYLEQPVWITDSYTILLVSIHVVGTGGGILCRVASCQLISPIHIGIIGNLETVFNLIFQVTLLGGYLYGRRNVLEVFGCILIVASITLSGLFSNREKHEDFES